MTDRRNLADWDQTELFNEICRVLKAKFGRLPKTGVLAGQSVASAVYELVGLEGQGPFKDMDLFMNDFQVDNLIDDIKTRVHSGERKLFPLLSSLTASANKLSPKGHGDNLIQRYNTLEMDVDEGPYGSIFARARNQKSYSVKTVIEPSVGYPLNVVVIEQSGVRSTEVDAGMVIGGFDLNLTQAAIDLDDKTVCWSTSFQQFLFRHNIKVDSCHTPAGTALRIVKKIKAMPWTNCDIDWEMHKLQEARKLSRLYEQKMTDMYCEKLEKGGTFNNRTIFAAGTGRRNEEGVLPFHYSTNPTKQVRMPGCYITQKAADEWKEWESTLSKYFRLSKPDTLIETESNEFDLDYDPSKRVTHMYRVDAVGHAKNSAWAKLFGKKMLDSHCFVENLSEMLWMDYGKLEGLFGNMDWVLQIADGRGKEAKARKAILQEIVMPEISLHAEDEDKITRQKIVVNRVRANEARLREEERKREQIRDDLGEKKSYRDRSDNMRWYYGLLKILLLNLDGVSFRGLQLKTMKQHMKYIHEENFLFAALMRGAEEQKKIMDGYASMRKLNARHLIQGVEHNPRLSIMDIMMMSKAELRDLEEKEEFFQRCNGVEPLLEPKEFDGVEIRELANAGDLRVQGKREKHCVAGYIYPVRTGDCLILALRSEENSSTAEIGLNRRGVKDDTIRISIVQHHAKMNSSPDPSHQKVLEAWCEEFASKLKQHLNGDRFVVRDEYWGQLVASVKGGESVINGESRRNEYPMFERIPVEMDEEPSELVA